MNFYDKIKVLHKGDLRSDIKEVITEATNIKFTRCGIGVGNGYFSIVLNKNGYKVIYLKILESGEFEYVISSKLKDDYICDLIKEVVGNHYSQYETRMKKREINK